jgi:thioredoxin 1
MKEVLISFIVALFIGAAINGLPKATPRSAPSTSTGTEATLDTVATADPAEAEVTGDPQAEAAIVETSQDKFGSEVLDSKDPVLVDFYADWCGPCKQMSPVVAKIAKQYEGRAKVFKVNIDRNPDLVSKYSIQSIPTFIIFKHGRAAETFAGSMPRADLTAALDKQLN